MEECKISFFNNRKTYPLITLKRAVIFPGTVVPLILEGEEMVETVNKATAGDHSVVLNFTRNGTPGRIGIVAKIIQFWYLAPQIMGATLEGGRRVKVIKSSEEGGIHRAEIEELAAEGEKDKTTLEALSRNIFKEYSKLLKAEGTLSTEAAQVLRDETMPPEKIGDLIASSLRIGFDEKMKLLETVNTKDRLMLLSEELERQLAIAAAEKKIQEKVSKEVDKTQRDYFLREQMKAIEKELGIAGEREEYAELERRINKAGMPEVIKEKTVKEFNRLRRMPPGSPEAPYITNYLDLLVDLPWVKKSGGAIDLKGAEDILNKDHYGLEKVKERILEYLAVQKLTNGQARGTILSFVGPPGTGKTSVGQSIARTLGRKFTRISLGGIRDESEIRGHRRTYVGAMPGRIIEGMRRAGTKNPVFMLDEVDKVGVSYLGDPAAALLEVLDPAQNNNFVDHYLDVPFDLSDVFFITTANIADTIPEPLRDRMEMIEFTGYTNEEKLHIARQFILPRVRKDSGLQKMAFDIDDEGLNYIITRYTREAGVRDLERRTSQVARRVAREIIENKKPKMSIGREDIPKYLGPEQFPETIREKEDEVGVATGLAWTPAGGEIIYIESSVVPGRRGLTLTGQLGDVMKESAQAALTYVRSQSEKLEFNPDFYQKSDIHLHVPAGSVPKDGASAGVAMAVALASALARRKAKKEIAMTGEITLRGKVLPVGGIKEKVVAAYRAGVKTVILPSENKKDLVDVPAEVKNNLELVFIDKADAALERVLDKIENSKG